jgi:N12 class adenine-specific DNA methylase
LNAEKVLEWLYKDAEENNRMERKYKKWINKPTTKHYDWMLPIKG